MSESSHGAIVALSAYMEEASDHRAQNRDGLSPLTLSQTLHIAGKRSIDLVGAGVGLLILSPLLVILAMMVRVNSPGPIFFRQTRLGQRGREFRVWKFRTMVVDAEAKLKELEHLNESPGGVLFKIKSDPRVTSLGRFLRKSSLDELPQLFNVLSGQMSLVGPRPLQLRDCELLQRANPEGFQRRLAHRPGLSGPWQVSGRSDVAYDQMLDMDLDYIQNWSLAKDMMIILKTVQVVFTGRGAS